MILSLRTICKTFWHFLVVSSCCLAILAPKLVLFAGTTMKRTKVFALPAWNPLEHIKKTGRKRRLPADSVILNECSIWAVKISQSMKLFARIARSSRTNRLVDISMWSCHGCRRRWWLFMFRRSWESWIHIFSHQVIRALYWQIPVNHLRGQAWSDYDVCVICSFVRVQNQIDAFGSGRLIFDLLHRAHAYTEIEGGKPLRYNCLAIDASWQMLGLISLGVELCALWNLTTQESNKLIFGTFSVSQAWVVYWQEAVVWTWERSAVHRTHFCSMSRCFTVVSTCLQISLAPTEAELSLAVTFNGAWCLSMRCKPVKSRTLLQCEGNASASKVRKAPQGQLKASESNSIA